MKGAEKRLSLLSKVGTNKPVKARLWPLLEPVSARQSSIVFKVFPPRSIVGNLGDVGEGDGGRVRFHLDLVQHPRILLISLN